MRVFSKKAFAFEHGGAAFLTEPMGFHDMPDHFAECVLFSWALNDGDIEVIGDSAKRKKIEREPGKPSVKRAKAAPSGDAV